MKKKIYIPPDSQFVMFVPDHALAVDDNSAWWSFWNWGKYTETASVTGTVEVWDDTKAPDWIYQGNNAKKPY